MKTYKQGQRVKVEFENDFHGTKGGRDGTIVRFEGDLLDSGIATCNKKKSRKKLCGFSDCRCQKITKAIAVESGKEVLLTY